jgi:c-di-GMP-binding flagellar brake protein YcgR
VEAEDEAGIVLSLAVTPPAGFQRMLDRPVRVECISPRGIQRVSGTATWDASVPDELRVTRERDALIQRRETVRIEAVVPAEVSVAGPAAESAHTTTLNLSVTGFLLRDPLELAVGAEVRVRLVLEDGGPPLEITGTVVREGGPDQKGVHIEAISRDDRGRLTRLITERQRAELRLARNR